jgi:hypothetical protein
MIIMPYSRPGHRCSSQAKQTSGTPLGTCPVTELCDLLFLTVSLVGSSSADRAAAVICIQNHRLVLNRSMRATTESIASCRL